ncbi:MAG TPA: bifunctional tRNA (5-methylaminomethyl-2-thiouridine)(34)-methyltransferase MnmD/FAD-dependent 5-carboxymethylaminomethyl-2-thiouridine(34) oxidoreductase MnmC [Burkholderiales bacterium]|nr:bifunctional tRNA (5-methylaminomethyl-2-thiouridine)(34)-methyltransferase MnmD/FAD-dependent 5-carboxymethylaminomethyl-2-thiouridine(34) oxidoreductase MnmC [Burkholderiales bacterium]
MAPLLTARLAFDPGGIPYSETYGDVYHSSGGGPEQARHVFLAGNGLPERWRGRNGFTVVETGFGLGHNFLATCAALLEDALAPRLHYVSVEKHPFEKRDLATALARYPDLPLASDLLARWPLPLPGFHRLHLARGRVTLTLLFGDAQDLLPQLEASADGFYLDGFSPDKNPEMWSPAIAKELARLAAPGATLATWTVAGAVRAALGEAGFAVAKRPGFGPKREMLAGTFQGPPKAAAAPRERHAAVVGAGIAGTSCAERLAARGWEVTLIERRSAPAQEASGNPVGLLRPPLHLEDTALARLSRAALGYAFRHFAGLEGEARALPWKESGVLRLARDKRQMERFEQAAAAFPAEFARCVDAAEAARIAGRAVRGPGVWLASSGWVSPPELCAGQVQSDRIRRVFSSEALRLVASGSEWRIEGKQGTLAQAPHVIVAAAGNANALLPHAPLPLTPVRGQISFAPRSGRLDVPVGGDGFVAPTDAGFVLGATFQLDDPEPSPRAADHAANLARAESLLPGFAEGLDPTRLAGRVAFRATTPDRLPIYGELPWRPGVHAALGLGANGLLWAPLCAEWLASRLEGEPWPIERELAEAIGAGRFAATRI